MSAETQKNTPFMQIEPWEESVDGTMLANEIENVFTKHMSLPNGASPALTMWVLHTYAIDLFNFTPRLCIVSPDKRCGKSTLLRLVEKLSNRSINVSSITASALFRSIEKWQPTICIDEADTFLAQNEDLRGIINCGYDRDGHVARTESNGKQLEPQFFACYAPVAIAAIGTLPPTILDRGIIITMRRKKRSEEFDRVRMNEIREQLTQIQRKCLRFITDNEQQIREAKVDIPNRFNDRAADIWEPLYQLAATVSPEWLIKLRTASLSLVNTLDAEDKESDGVQLLADIRQIFMDGQSEWLESMRLIELLTQIEEAPWKTYGHGGLNPHMLASLLRPFGIKPQQRREHGTRSRRYERKDFQDAFERYLPALEQSVSDCATEPASTEDIPY